MSSTVIIILLPSIARDVHIAEPQQQWVVSAFSLTSGSFLLLAGKLGDVYGRKMLFILGNFWFTATSFGVAFSPNEICLFVMRALQGLVFLYHTWNCFEAADFITGMRIHCCNRDRNYRIYHPSRTSKDLQLLDLLWWRTCWRGSRKLTSNYTSLISY